MNHDEVILVASEAFNFYGKDARKVAAKNAMGKRFNEQGRKFWFAVWKALLDVEDQG